MRRNLLPEFDHEFRVGGGGKGYPWAAASDVATMPHKPADSEPEPVLPEAAMEAPP